MKVTLFHFSDAVSFKDQAKIKLALFEQPIQHTETKQGLSIERKKSVFLNLI